MAEFSEEETAPRMSLPAEELEPLSVQESSNSSSSSDEASHVSQGDGLSTTAREILLNAKRSCDEFLGKLEQLLKTLDNERALLVTKHASLEEQQRNLTEKERIHEREKEELRERERAREQERESEREAEREREKEREKERERERERELQHQQGLKAMVVTSGIPTSGVLKLDVGGEVFTTSFRTMSKREPDSILATMFSTSNSSNVILDPQGRYFIDRDGKQFGYILNYLRDGVDVQLPEDISSANQLLHEAQFYKLKGLIEVLVPHIRALEEKKQAASPVGEEPNNNTSSRSSPNKAPSNSVRTPTTSPPISPCASKSADLSSLAPKTPELSQPSVSPRLTSSPPIAISLTPPPTECPAPPTASGPTSSLATKIKETGELKPVIKAKHTNGVLCIQWSESVIVTAGINSKTIDVWDFNSGALLKSLSGHTGAVYCLAIRGNTLISGGSDGKYKVWDLASYSCIRSKKAHVTLLCLKFDDELLVTAGIDAGNSFIKLWNVKDGVYLKAFAGHKESIWCLELSETKIVSGSHDCTVRVWDRKTGQCLRTLKAHTGPLRSLALGKQIVVSGSEDGDIRVWDLDTGEVLNILSGHTKTVVALFYNPIDSSILSASFDGTIKVWDHSSSGGACVASASCSGHGVYCFQLKENYVISGGEDGSIVLWN